MKDAQLLVAKPSLLVSAVNMIDALPLTEHDTKGDLYEYLLSKLTTAGINGQFRTPRHIIRFMVEMVEPKPTDTVGDPTPSGVTSKPANEGHLKTGQRN
jgi:type I restriction enzyme M protein